MRNKVFQFLVLLLLFPATSFAGVGVEARCTELNDEAGADCVCSEPMDSEEAAGIGTGTNPGTFRGSTSLPNGYDFVDSPSATDCSQHGTYLEMGTDTGNHPVSSANFSMPPGNAVAYVIEGNFNDQATGNTVRWLKGRGSEPAGSNRRTCVRYYKQVSTDWPPASNNDDGCQAERNKIMQFSWGSGNDQRFTQFVEPFNGSGCFVAPNYKNFGATLSDDPDVSVLSPNKTWADCFIGTAWCRFESCTHGDLANGNSIFVSHRVTIVPEDGSAVSVSETLDKGPQSYGESFKIAAADIYQQADDARADVTDGRQYLSHFMHADWDTDAGDNSQWIGAACEVEGGCGGSTPTGVLQ